jgi:WD40 repeat protein
MTPDDVEPLDDTLLARLLAAEEALAAGRDDAAGTFDGLEPDGISGYLDVLRRLGHPEAAVAQRGNGSTQPAAPPRLGRFDILETLGQGGFGIVYLAVDPTLGRQVALKVPRPEVVISPEVRRRFLREARAAAALDHPNLVAVHEVGETGPLCYIASAFCPGPTLSFWLKLRTEPVRPHSAARLVATLAGAVQHAHDRGILHRDIKPSNVILTARRVEETSGDEDLSPRLTDFGLARIGEEAGEETRTGVLLGSPPYMAPEQAGGRTREFGPATDVYGLGATLYEVLTGRPPFRGETATETMRMVLEADCVAPRVLRGGLPRDLETICLKCLEKDPARRYASAAALRGDLERFLRGEPIRTRPASWRLRAAKWVRRRPMHATALILVALATAGLVGGIVYRNVLLQGHARELEREVLRADGNARLARRHLQAFQLRQAQEALDARQVERAQDILSAIQADRDRSGRCQDPGDPGFAWHYVTRLARRDLVVLSDRQAERVSFIALSPDGKTLATGDEDGTIRLRDPETGRVGTILAAHRLGISQLAFSPDGGRLVSVGLQDIPPLRGEVLIWEINSGRLLARLEGFSDRDLNQVAFDPRGEHLWEVSWTESNRGRLGSWDLRTDPSHPRLTWSSLSDDSLRQRATDGPIVALEVTGERFHLHDLEIAMGLGWTGTIDRHQLAASSPDGRLLAILAAPWVVLWDVVKGRERARYESPRELSLTSIRFSPDGRYLALQSVTGMLQVRDLQTGESQKIPPGVVDSRPFASLAFSTDGRFLARNVSKLGSPQPTGIWRLDPWRQVATYPGVPGDGRPVFTQGDRSLIVHVNQGAIRWNYSKAPEPDQPAGHADEAWSVAFSPDGSILASGSDDTDEPQTIKLWDMAKSSLVRGWHAGRGTVAALAFDPQGQVLASAHLEKPGDIRLWDPATGRCLTILSGHTDYVRTVAFSPDGKALASAGSDLAVRLWDVTSRRSIRVLDGHTNIVRQVAFSPDGTKLASASNDFTVRLWDVARGACIRTLRAIDKVAAVTFAPDGRSLAAADERGVVSVWDVDSGVRLHNVPSERDLPLCLAYSRDGRSLAVAGKSRTIRLWDPLTAQEMLTLNGHKAQVNGVAFSPDGSVLASCSHDGAVRLWRAGPIDPAERP